MNEEERKRIIEILESGEMIPSDWITIMFPNKKFECELVYHGKSREEDILADTMSIPFQETRTFGDYSSGWCNKLIFGDNLQIMKSLLEEKKSGHLCNVDGSHGIRLIYIDPPFSTSKEMKSSSGERAYQDKLAEAQFLEFLRKRLILMRELLSDNGSIYVHMDWRMNSYVRILMDEIFGKNNFQREIIWDVRVLSGYKTIANNWVRGHDTILFYSKSSNFLFNKKTQPHTPEYLAQFNKEDEHGKYMIAHKIKRYRKEVEDKGKPFGDVWDNIKSFQQQPTSAEKIDYPTQKPETLLERMIEASSNKGDIVADFFLGSGTTIAVAEKLGRKWIGSDCGKLSLYTSQKRMLNLRVDIGNKGDILKPKPFSLLNAGLYELEQLSEESSENWRKFVLQLFQCRDDIHLVNGVKMDGKFKGKSVLIFDPKNLQKGQLITEETIQDLHSNIGHAIGNEMFLIAPAMSYGFFQDYIDIDLVRYYALRIPYSIINELHKRDFTSLRQPDNENAVNETVDAVGFDFNRVPDLDINIGREYDREKEQYYIYIKIRVFKSEARIPDTLKISGNRKTLSMLMIDKNYDSKKGIFNCDSVFFSDELSKSNWKALILLEEIGDEIMAIFVDCYGNEASRLIRPDSIHN